MSESEPPIGEKIEFADYEERILKVIHGVTGDGVGLRGTIRHRLIFPKRPPNTQQMIIVFYCDHDILVDVRKNAEKIFGDSDFTKSIARFLRAGKHWMDNSADVETLKDCAVRKQSLERDIVRLQEEWGPLNEKHGGLIHQITVQVSNVKALEEHRLDAIDKLLDPYIERVQEKIVEYDRLCKETWGQKCSRLISKLVRKLTLRK